MHNTNKKISNALFHMKTQAAWTIISLCRKWTQNFDQSS